MSAKRILVVDDAPVDRVKLAAALKTLGCTVDLCADGPSALEAVEAVSYDLVMLDLYMPDMDGCAVLRALKADQATQDLPVIIVTSTESPEDLKRVMDLGAVAHLAKPYTTQSLSNALATVF